jgi:hypothetical protein
MSAKNIARVRVIRIKWEVKVGGEIGYLRTKGRAKREEVENASSYSLGIFNTHLHPDM